MKQRPLGKMSIVYCNASDVNGMYHYSRAAQFFKSFDMLILADKTQTEDHWAYLQQRSFIAELKAEAGRDGRHLQLLGYVDLGVTTQNNSDAVMKDLIRGWKRIGATGIFFDDAGYDFQTTRARQNTYVDYAHSLGMNVCMNPWNMDDVLVESNGVGHKLTSKDYILLESFAVNTTSYTASPTKSAAFADLTARGAKALAAQREHGVQFIASNAYDLSTATDTQVADFVRLSEHTAAMYGCSFVGLDAVGYAATAPNSARVRRHAWEGISSCDVRGVNWEKLPYAVGTDAMVNSDLDIKLFKRPDTGLIIKDTV